MTQDYCAEIKRIQKTLNILERWKVENTAILIVISDELPNSHLTGLQPVLNLYLGLLGVHKQHYFRGTLQ